MMAKSGKSGLTTDELVSAIEKEEESSYGYHTGELSAQRQQALQYYLGDAFPDDDEIPAGRSRVISTDVCDTIEWIMPTLLKIFTAGNEIVLFDPVGPEDAQAAEQETAYINHVVTQKNDAFLTFYEWFKDALIQKTGYVKAWYEKKTVPCEETYEGLNDQELAMLVQDGWEPIEHSATIDEMTQTVYHDVKVRKTETYGCVRYEACPPEEIFVSTSHRSVSLKESPFVEHKTKVSISYLREMGFDIADDISDASGDETEERNRDMYNEWREENQHSHPASRMVWLRDAYICIDYDGDGIAERRRVMLVGKQVLLNEPFDLVPIAALCPVIMPHRHVGLSYADLIMDLQEIKSMLLRQNLDNMYIANNGRYAVSDRVNLDDLLVSRPGGVVRVDGDPAGAIMPLQHPLLGPIAFSMLEYVDGIRETRTGITKYNQGTDANSLNKTATGINAIMGAAAERILMIARIFAETGVKDLFLIVHALIQKHEKTQQMFRLRNQWVPVDPRQWKTRTDMTISVGLGTGNKDQMMSHLSMMLQIAMNVMPTGVTNPEGVYSILRRMTETMGFKNPDEFWTNPANNQPQPPPPDPNMIKIESDMKKAQAEMMLDKEKSDQQMMLEREKMQAEIALEREKMMAEIALKREEMQNQAQLEAMKIMASKEQCAMDHQFQRDSMMMQGMQKEYEKEGEESDDKLGPALEKVAMGFAEMMTRPKRVIRDENGNIAGVE
jgi:hypothetical protein